MNILVSYMLLQTELNLLKKDHSVLKNCNCEEYKELKEIIEGKKQSKY